MTADWNQIRQDYSQGASFAELSRRWGVSVSTIRRHARAAGWEKEGEAPEMRGVQKEERQQRRTQRVDELADRMLACLERAVDELDAVTKTVKERVKKEDGTDVTTDYTQVFTGEQGPIDRSGLKQLTGVLKDLKEVLSIRSEEETLEQEARIQKLHRDLGGETPKILVTMEGGCEHYAD